MHNMKYEYANQNQLKINLFGHAKFYDYFFENSLLPTRILRGAKRLLTHEIELDRAYFEAISQTTPIAPVTAALPPPGVQPAPPVPQREPTLPPPPPPPAVPVKNGSSNGTIMKNGKVSSRKQADNVSASA